MTTMTPTVGRRIHFWPSTEHAAQLGVFDATQPCDAGVLYAWPDGTINIDVTGPSGGKLSLQRVRIVPKGEDCLEDESHARWMDYQTAKAAQETREQLAPGVFITPASGALDVGTTGYADGTQATGVLPLPAESPAAPPAPDAKTSRKTRT